jgi:DNA-binding HxlR family transcriptional regulator
MMAKKIPESCGLGPALEVIAGKWKAQLLWEIHRQPRRFGELKRRISGISEKMLIQHLREMEADGIVQRRIFPEAPPRVEYSVTDYGAELDNALIPLANWGKRHARRLSESRSAEAEGAPAL